MGKYLRRPYNYRFLSEEEKWAIDKDLGILDMANIPEHLDAEKTVECCKCHKKYFAVFEGSTNQGMRCASSMWASNSGLLSIQCHYGSELDTHRYVFTSVTEDVSNLLKNGADPICDECGRPY